MAGSRRSICCLRSLRQSLSHRRGRLCFSIRVCGRARTRSRRWRWEQLWSESAGPYVYGLALDGAEGVRHVLRSILAEADLFMAVNGYPTIADLRVAGAIRNAAVAFEA